MYFPRITPSTSNTPTFTCERFSASSCRTIAAALRTVSRLRAFGRFAVFFFGGMWGSDGLGLGVSRSGDRSHKLQTLEITAPAQPTHLGQDPRLTAAHIRARCAHATSLRVRQRRREQRAFGCIESRCWFSVVRLRRSFDAVDPITELGDVEVNLENPLLRPQRFDREREVGFEHLADPVLTLPQEQVLRDLLRDRRRTAQPSSSARLFDRYRDLLHVETEVIRETLIL